MILMMMLVNLMILVHLLSTCSLRTGSVLSYISITYHQDDDVGAIMTIRVLMHLFSLCSSLVDPVSIYISSTDQRDDADDDVDVDFEDDVCDFDDLGALTFHS